MNVGRDFFERSGDDFFRIWDRFSSYLRNFFITHLLPDSHRKDKAITLFECIHIGENRFESIFCVYIFLFFFCIGRFPGEIFESLNRGLISQMIYQSCVSNMENPWKELSRRLSTKLRNTFQGLRIDILDDILSKSCIEGSIKKKSVDTVIWRIVEFTESCEISRFCFLYRRFEHIWRQI